MVRYRIQALSLSTLLLASGLAQGCSADATSEPDDPGTQAVGEGDRTKNDMKADTSAEAVFVDMEFDGSLETGSAYRPESEIEDQLLYTIGHLNEQNSVGRLDQVQLTNVQVENVEGKVVITYHARLPVAWGERDQVPTSYTFRLPKDNSYQGKQAFTEKYKANCVDSHAHDVDSGTMWYYYRPEAWGCNIDAADVVTTEATVSLSTVNTTGKYPEYHKVWEDDALRVLAVFGKYEDNATTSGDAGISGYNSFITKVTTELSAYQLVTTPETVPSSPGVEVPDIQFEATLTDGKRVQVNALLVDNIRTADAAFNTRYESLTPQADLITYNGHSGLGQNVRAMAQKGQWVAGQYAMVFLNGCDSFAYVDSALADAHIAVNTDDPLGTKYLDVMTNAMPSFFRSMPYATWAIAEGLLSYESPVTYEQIFKNIDRDQVILVAGEQDNEYFPGWPGGGENPVENWEGMDGNGTVAEQEETRFETPKLAVGTYLFEMTGTDDADLYVRVGEAPTTEHYDCRPYKTGSNETCTVDLSNPAPIHVMVRGWKPTSDYQLVGRKQ